MMLPNGKLEFSIIENRNSNDLKLFASLCVIISVGFFYLEYSNNINTENPLQVAMIWGVLGSWVGFFAYLLNFRKTFKKLNTKLIITPDQISYIDLKNKPNKMLINEISDLTITLSSYDHLSGTWPLANPYSKVQGRGNIIGFNYKEVRYCFELYVEKKINLILLSRLIKEWQENGNNISFNDKVNWK